MCPQLLISQKKNCQNLYNSQPFRLLNNLLAFLGEEIANRKKTPNKQTNKNKNKKHKPRLAVRAFPSLSIRPRGVDHLWQLNKRGTT